MRSYKLIKRLISLLLAALVQLSTISVFATTMQQAKGQQSALEVEVNRTEAEILAFEQDAAEKLAYIAQLDVEVVAVQKEMDELSRRIVLLDDGIAKSKDADHRALMGRARENLVLQKEEFGYRLDNIFALQKDMQNLIEDTETAKQAAQQQQQILAQERKKTDAAIDDWYARYRAAQINAGVSLDNLGGDVLQGTGAFLWPMPGYTEMTQYFGGEHRGLDIAGGGIYGKSIVAAAAGTVAYAGWMGSYGYVVFVDHGNGYQTRYAHMSALGCAVGDTVAANDVIGYVGSTGNSTGPHLHFEILYNDTVVDPFLYF